MINLTIFESRYDNKTDKVLTLNSFDELESLLYKLSEKEINSKNDAQLISPASFIEDTTRKNDNVVSWSFAMIDVDDIQVDTSVEEYIQDMFPTWRYVCYSTASSTKENPKFRLVFALDRKLETDDIIPFWYALQQAIGDMADEQTKDKARMYYIPAKYKDAYNFIFSSNGKEFINTKSLMNKYPYTDNKGKNTNFLDRLPEEWRNQIIDYRKNKADNTDFVWTSYLNCPFWPQNLAREYNSITSTGWYRKMYQIMVAVAGNAIKRQYPITPKEIAELCKQFDTDTGNWYANRPLESEADRAIEYVYRNM